MMEEKKRCAWIEMFRQGDNFTTYDQMGIKESFNEFFENIIKIDGGKDIQRYYKISLHLIIFLTIQKKIRDDIEKQKNNISPEDMQILELDSRELFWPSTRNMPKLFVFNRVPYLTVPEEKIFNIKEIAHELSSIKNKKEIPGGYPYYKILSRALRGEELVASAVFKEDRFCIQTLQTVFKQFQKLKHNKTADDFYRKYETTYFLNCYCQDRFYISNRSFFEEDIEFAYPQKNEVTELVPSDTNEKHLEIRLADRKLVLVLNACAEEFCRRQHLPRTVEILMAAIIRTFLTKEKNLGYFEDYPAEALLVCFGSIAACVHRKTFKLPGVYSTFKEMGFIISYYFYERHMKVLSIEDVLVETVAPTYNRLLPSILRTSKVYKRRGPKPGSFSLQTPERQQPPQGGKYILSPLSGRMSQILPVNTRSKKILFKNNND
ncbi:hypothetical protein NECID01_0250 [Nematocida sp. AWRm77]|nr:hypothetical protein NECID01_0250 [Nematocida sp. AWRm77]